MIKLIALVATAVLVDGVRTVIEPGQPLPPLGEHDERALLQAGAAQDPDDSAALAQADARFEADALSVFAAARERVQQAQASTTTESTEPTESTTTTPPAAKSAARK